MSTPNKVLGLSQRLAALGATFIPSRGPVGTVFAMVSGFYVRTPWGIMRCRPEVGMSVLFRQRAGKTMKYLTLALSILTLIAVLY